MATYLYSSPRWSYKGRVKGNADAELVLQAMIEFPNYDKTVIVTGDGDFQCLVKYLRNQNKLLKLIVPDERNYSSLLRGFTPYIMSMNRLRGKLGKK